MLSSFGKIFRSRSRKVEAPSAQTPLMRVLEPRVLLDAAGVETALDQVNDSVHAGLADDWFARRVANAPAAATPPQPEIILGDADSDEAPASASEGMEYVFIAADVEDVETIVAALPPTARVVMLEADEDGVEAIAAALEGETGVAAVHIVGHGRPGALALGTAELTAASMTRSHAALLARIGAALAPDADLLVYGCDFGAGAEGAAAAAAPSAPAPKSQP